jgi:HAMP domain-containing protein
MFNPFRKSSARIYTIDPETKAELLKLLAGVEESQKSRYPRLALMLKLATGYIAMAVFTMAALTFSAFTLYGIQNTTREVAYVDLPAISSLEKLRTSLLAQENYAGKYAILKDPAFIKLFQQREKETLAALAALEQTGAAEETAALKHVYLQYQRASAALFAGRGKKGEPRAAATKVLEGVDLVLAQRQEMLQGLVTRGDKLRQSTIKRTIIIACGGFLIAIALAVIISYRIVAALKRLQTATHHLAAGDFQYDLVTPVGDELSELAGNFAKIAERLKALEGTRGAAKPAEATPREAKPGAGGNGAAP